MPCRHSVFIALLLASFAGSARAQEDEKPSLHYWHLWTGKDGKSHLTDCVMSDFERQTLSAQWHSKQPGKVDLNFAYNPLGDWHENPRVQWVTPLSGTFYIEAQDGSYALMQPGTLYLGEDLNTVADEKGHKGHVSANKSDKPLVLMIAQTDAKPTVGEPCHAK